MASAARGESSNPYGGLGTGGKFRKPTARRSQKTPYDRPPTSVRNPGAGGGEGRGGGWLSKLVDPAQRLITYSAHRLFASVFRKRLVSGESPLQSPEPQQRLPERDVMQETKVGNRENTSANDAIGIQEANASSNQSKDGFTDLEKMLKEKTFTRSEVDRLTTLLRSKAADSSTINGDQRNEVSIARHPPSHERDRAHPDNGIMNALVSTPYGSSRALDECIASPAQLAKAYMGNRPSEVTPSMLELRGQAAREDSVFLNRTPFPSRSPTLSLVPKLSGHRPRENGFVTPRSRGRSAVYSMARTPRPQSTVKIGSLLQASPSTWEESLSSGSRRGFQSGLKRRSSVLDSDIGYVGPVRRIRQKSNLSSRSLALPASESPLYVRASGGQNITDPSGDIPGSNVNLVPSQSQEMASKIWQHIDKMGSTKEKSPSKLSPSMLRGPALKSLQNVEMPNLLDNLLERKANSPGSSHQKQEKSRESSSREFLVPNGKTGGAADDTSKAGSIIDQETRVKGACLPLTSSLEEHPPKKRAFRMIADEDFLELDDDHGEASYPIEVAEKQNALKVEKSDGKKPLTSSEAMASTSYIPNGDASQSTSNGSRETGRSQFSALPIKAVQPSIMPSEPTSKLIQGTEKSSISPSKLTSEGEVISREEPKQAAAVFPNTFSSPAATDLLNQNTGASADIKLEKPSSFAFGASEAFGKPTESKKNVSNSASGTQSTTSAESTLNGSIFSGGANAISQPQINGSLGSSPSFPPSISNIPSNNSGREVPCTVQSFATTPAATSVFGKVPADTSNDINSGSNSQSTPAPPVSSTSSFKFEEPATAPFSASAVSASSGQISKETEVKNPTFGNINPADTSTENAFAAKSSEIKSTPDSVFGSSFSAFGGSTLNPSSASAPGSSASLAFGVTSSSTATPGTETSKFSGSFAATNGSKNFGTSSPAFTSSGSSEHAASTASSVFGFNAVSSASSSQSQASNLGGAANVQTGNTGSGTKTSTQSSPFLFGSSASAQTGNTASGTTTSTQSSPFLFGSSASAQTGNTASGTTASTQTAPFMFGSSTSAQTGNTGSGTTASTQTAPFMFGSSTPAQTGTTGSGTTTSTQTAPFMFGSSTPAQTGTTWSGTTTSTQSAPFMFASSASAPSFGLSGNKSSSNSSPFGLSKSEPAVFASGSTPQLSSSNSSASSSGTTSSPLFGTNWQAPNSDPAFGSSFTTSSSPTFLFGGSSAATASSASAPMFFSSTIPAVPQQSVFGNSAPTATPSQSPFGNSTPGFAFGATAPPPNTNGFNNNQQMSMEDSMAEDTDQANKASMVQQPMFGQQSVSMPQTSFVFGGAPATPPPSMANPFQFGGQPIASTPQNASPFQASHSLEFQGGGSFSLGSTGGGDKSGRRIFKAKKTNRKK